MWSLQVSPELKEEFGQQFGEFVEFMIKYFELQEVFIAIFVTEEELEQVLKYSSTHLKYFMIIIGLQQFQKELTITEAAEVALIHELQHIRLLLDRAEFPDIWTETEDPVVYYANPKEFFCFATEALWQTKIQPYLDQVINFIHASGETETIQRYIAQLPYRHTSEVVRMLERR